ncbi:gliding motility protein GldN [Pedobacter glucosidilyticus]|uniref:type IX secretion system ring protein PorN/GldN n=1 Tax=Pedobacter glucosidilyticus TaxID=1122941 RepID=UPI0026EF655A|nr:gliding motility protein GldN [Pedobacter glucosidilyticus]
MKKIIFSFLVALVSTSVALGQTPGAAQTTTPAVAQKKKKAIVRSIHDFTDSVKYDKNISKDSIKCAPEMPKVKADDVTYSKRVWRDIFFVENANKFLSAAEPKKNIIRIILDEVRSQKMEGYNNDKFELDVDSATIDGTLNTLGIISDEEFSDYEKNIKFGLRIMEDWYFDKNRSEFKPFIIGIAVIVPNTVNLNTGPALPGAGGGATPGGVSNLGELLNNMQPVVWINYPSVRERLCKYIVAHPNDKIKYSFDDIFQLRFFSSVITKESTPEDIRIKDRKDLATGIDKLLEAERIKRSLTQYEQDLWEY